MIGCLVVSHGKMAEGLKESVSLIMGENKQFAALGFFEEEDFEAFKNRFYQKIIQLDHGNGVLVFVDLFGATPYNVSAMLVNRLHSENHSIRVVTGVNLPMVLEILSSRNTQVNSLDELYLLAMSTGKESIKELLDEVGLKQ